jgi:hypothetical protein
MNKRRRLSQTLRLYLNMAVEKPDPMPSALPPDQVNPSGATSLDGQKAPIPLPILPSYKATNELSIADITEIPAAVANGVPAPTRASPSPNIPNGKPTSPYVERSNPMGQGAAQTVSSKDPKAAAAAATDMRNVVRRKLTGYVGFANLPNQWHRKSVRKGFNFNVMVVGTSGTKQSRETHANHVCR